MDFGNETLIQKVEDLDFVLVSLSRGYPHVPKDGFDL